LCDVLKEREEEKDNAPREARGKGALRSQRFAEKGKEQSKAKSKAESKAKSKTKREEI